MMLDNVTVLMRPNDFFDAGHRIRRINKTAQIVTGYWHVKQPFSEDIDGTVYISAMDHGMWRRLAQRSFINICAWIMKNGIAYRTFRRYFPNLPNKCPIMPGNYSYEPVVVARYRKDWDASLQYAIPPLIPEFDKYRMDLEYFRHNDTETILQIGRIDIRIFNKYSAVQ